jgi:hypothetical protein
MNLALDFQLRLACERGNLDPVKLFRQLGAKATTAVRGYSCLQVSVESTNAALVAYLLEHVIVSKGSTEDCLDIDYVNKHNDAQDTALSIAMRNNSVEIVSQLLAKNAKLPREASATWIVLFDLIARFDALLNDLDAKDDRNIFEECIKLRDALRANQTPIALPAKRHCIRLTLLIERLNSLREGEVAGLSRDDIASCLLKRWETQGVANLKGGIMRCYNQQIEQSVAIATSAALAVADRAARENAEREKAPSVSSGWGALFSRDRSLTKAKDAAIAATDERRAPLLSAAAGKE